MYFLSEETIDCEVKVKIFLGKKVYFLLPEGKNMYGYF